MLWINLKEDFILASSVIELQLKLIVSSRIKATVNELLSLENMTR